MSGVATGEFMAEPWDIPPFPKQGNASQKVLFAAIGRATAAWADVEVTFAHLLSVFLAGNQFDARANRAYGEKETFAHRQALLTAAAEAHWRKRPDQALEGRLKELMILAMNLSRRRNDIAHGVLRFIHWIREPNSRATLLSGGADLRWCLIPPHFNGKKFTSENRPEYVFTSREINRFAEAFWDLARDSSNLARKVENAAAGRVAPKTVWKTILSDY